jgi:hypothetical protein
VKARARDLRCRAKPSHRPDRAMRRDAGELHIAPLAQYAAALFRISRSALSLATSRRRRSISCCSGFICPRPGKACTGPEDRSRIQRRNTLSATSRSRDACATATPRSRTSFTASTLNSRLNTRRCMLTSDTVGKPYLGVHRTGSRPLGAGETPARAALMQQRFDA